MGVQQEQQLDLQILLMPNQVYMHMLLVLPGSSDDTEWHKAAAWHSCSASVITDHNK